MNKTENIIELAKALSKAQGEITAPKKNKTNPFLHNKYADIASIIEAIRAPLADNGLSLLQFPYIKGNLVTVKTVLLHDSGESIESSLTMEGENLGKGEVRKAMTIQAYAGTISYIRRYAIQTLLCIAADDDDDGATGRATKQEKPSEPPPPTQQEIEAVIAKLDTAYSVIEALPGSETTDEQECLLWLSTPTVRGCRNLDMLRAYFTYKKEEAGKITVEVQGLYDRIKSLLDGLEYHSKHVTSSVKKHLGEDVTRLEDCRDMEKLTTYYTYLSAKQEAAWAEDAEAPPADDHNGSPLPV